MTNERLSNILHNSGVDADNEQWIKVIKEKEVIEREKEILVEKYEKLVLRINGLDGILKIDKATQTDYL